MTTWRPGETTSVFARAPRAYGIQALPLRICAGLRHRSFRRSSQFTATCERDRAFSFDDAAFFAAL